MFGEAGPGAGVNKLFTICLLTFAFLCGIIVPEREVRDMKKFFGLDNKYKFDYGDLRAFITVINVILIMVYGLSIAWFGLAVAVIGVIKDLAVDHKINGLVMHLASVALNIYFLVVLYTG